MPVAYRIQIEFVWGHQSRIIGLSRSNPSFYYPPPTTIMGAIAESLSKRYGLGEKPSTARKLISSISGKLLAIGVRPINAVPIKYMDINKIIAVKKTGREFYPDPREIAKSFDAPARGKTIMVSLDDEPPTIEALLVLRDNVLNVLGKRMIIDRGILWDIHRLGSKESIVSIRDVEEAREVEIISERIVSTMYSFPVNGGVDIIDEINGRWVYEMYINPFTLFPEKSILEYYLEGKNIVLYKIPILSLPRRKPMARLRISEPLVAYKAVFNGHYKPVIVGRRP